MSDPPTLFEVPGQDSGDDGGIEREYMQASVDREGMVEEPAQGDTSAEAARRIAPLTGAKRLEVLAAIVHSGHYGLTDEEGQELTGMNQNTYRPRRVELSEGYKDIVGGWVEDSGKRRDTRSGVPAKVWVATNKGWSADIARRGRPND